MLLRSMMREDGRRTAVEAMVDRYGPTVLRYLAASLDNVQIARAALVEVFILALRRYSARRKEADEERWLMSLADEVMKQTTHPFVPYLHNDDGGETEPCGLADAEDPTVNADAADGDQEPQDRLPLAFRVQISQWLWATAAHLDAERKHRGPAWTVVGVIAVLVLGFAAIGAGAIRRSPPAAMTMPSVDQTTPHRTALPEPVLGLPAVPVGQFRLAAGDSVDMHHIAFARQTLYLGSLSVPVNDWPQIVLRRVLTADSGKSLSKSIAVAGRIDLVPPLASAGHSNGIAKGW
ncbi:MAG: hypothetical protein K6T83_20895, partial [Alicyclobacillus sp.]|nr:hypothetical protein [Alicyclobacillus sp.]